MPKKEGFMSAESDSPRRSLLARLVPKFIVAHGAKHMWGPLLPVISHLSPRLISGFSALMDNDEFARAVAATPDEQLEAGMQTKLRGVILDEIVRRMQIEFMPNRAGKLDAVIQFEITGRPGGGSDVYQIQIKDGACTVGGGFTDAPASVIVLDGVNFLKLATGVISGIDLYIGGKLKWDGGMMMLTRLTRMFNIPSMAEQPVAA
jgi:putative sterol carrier protein